MAGASAQRQRAVRVESDGPVVDAQRERPSAETEAQVQPAPLRWQALVFGFAGVRPRGDMLVVDPRIPPQWGGLQIRLRFRGKPFVLRIDHQSVELDAAGALALTRRDGHWEVHAP